MKRKISGAQDSCTSIMVGRLASTDGSVITSHTCDGRYRTWVKMEPAADHAPAAMHAIFRGTMKTVSPDDHVAVSANIPRISWKSRKDKDVMFSSNVEQVARDNGLWDGKGEFVFWKVYNCDYSKGRNFHDREYFILNHLAPSLGLTYDMDELPFSVRAVANASIENKRFIKRNSYTT